MACPAGKSPRGLDGGDAAVLDEHFGWAQGTSGAVGELRSGEQFGVGHAGLPFAYPAHPTPVQNRTRCQVSRPGTPGVVRRRRSQTLRVPSE
ncbi:hypothetical protein BJ970_005935 [Saccharopolyspora phatthalungensis]|uniref:Uncharacterized protein n=1 Tax=Saccharopolyspora phatthalungensis TaxID=664693 RepID=A0A840QD63_9PSEU|nr:hypothetical protein [Saccharopolyspora phatthalungensis]